MDWIDGAVGRDSSYIATHKSARTKPPPTSRDRGAMVGLTGDVAIGQTGTADAAGYGWLGAKQRSTTTASAGLTLMGDRYYNATTGRFTALNPVPGGDANAYTYPTDPINAYDLNGRCWGWCPHISWGHMFHTVGDFARSSGGGLPPITGRGSSQVSASSLAPCRVARCARSRRVSPW